MTRDEAVELVMKGLQREMRQIAEGQVESFSQAGIIKLDDPPKSIESKMVAIFGHHATWNFREFENGLMAHGLKIIEA